VGRRAGDAPEASAGEWASIGRAHSLKRMRSAYLWDPKRRSEMSQTSQSAVGYDRMSAIGYFVTYGLAVVSLVVVNAGSWLTTRPWSPEMLIVAGVAILLTAAAFWYLAAGTIGLPDRVRPLASLTVWQVVSSGCLITAASMVSIEVPWKNAVATALLVIGMWAAGHNDGRDGVSIRGTAALFVCVFFVLFIVVLGIAAAFKVDVMLALWTALATVVWFLFAATGMLVLPWSRRAADESAGEA
jgi:hypothetical protein